MPERNKHSPNRNAHNPNRRKYTRRRIAATALVLGVPLAVDAISSGQSQSYQDGQEAQALKDSNEAPLVLNQVVAFKEGTKFYTHPVVSEATAGDSSTTLAGVVKNGEILRVDRPRTVYTDLDGRDWYSFIQYQGKKKGDATDQEDTFWILADDPSTVFDVYNYTDSSTGLILNAESGPPVHLAYVNRDTGNLAIEGLARSVVIDRGSLVPADIFGQMVRNEGLEQIT